ncbi:cysteine desulfurase family protein [Pontiellaceae bacterium B12219]|nr:cysteine desulfurase family protein [Pontiellaceae bacterium B12219]
MYFDYAATTPPKDEVLKTFDAVNRTFWANPHALHRPGTRADSLLEQSRKQILALLGAGNDYTCVFTSGATEANNLALKGIAGQYRARGNHIITSEVEHLSVLSVCSFLSMGDFELTVLPVNAGGTVDPDKLQEALRPDTILVSLMHVNNETGSVNDIMQLGEVIKSGSNAVFHVDAAQSVGKFDLSLDESPVDLLTFSAHKFFGLKGAGALILKNRLQLTPLIHGGGQESGMRSGTADTARAAAMAKALRLSLEERESAFVRVQSYKKNIAATLNEIEGTELNGPVEQTSPFILNCSVSGVRPETLLQGLSEKGIYISTVSACSSQKTAASHVVLALTGSRERAQSSIRISLSAVTTQEEVDALCETLPPLIESLRFKRK